MERSLLDGLQGDVLGDPLYVCGDIPMGQHHALGVARRARGEHYFQQVVGACSDRVGGAESLDAVLQFLECNLRSVKGHPAPWA